MTPEQKAKRDALAKISRENNRSGSYLEKKKKLEEDLKPQSEDTGVGMWEDASDDFLDQEMSDVKEFEAERKKEGKEPLEYKSVKEGLVPIIPPKKPYDALKEEDEQEDFPTGEQSEKAQSKSFRELLEENKKKPIKLSR